MGCLWNLYTPPPPFLSALKAKGRCNKYSSRANGSNLGIIFCLQNQYEFQVPYRFWKKRSSSITLLCVFSIVHTESGIVV